MEDKKLKKPDLSKTKSRMHSTDKGYVAESTFNGTKYKNPLSKAEYEAAV